MARTARAIARVVALAVVLAGLSLPTTGTAPAAAADPAAFLSLIHI